MAVGWFLAPYRLTPPLDENVGLPSRYCGVEDYLPQIQADLGGCAYAECLGNQAVVKVKASAATLQTIAADAAIVRIPIAQLDSPLASLTTAQKNAIATRVQALGYTAAEINTAFPGGIGGFTLRQLLVFVLSRRLEDRWDAPTQTVICDGPVMSCRPVADVDAAVQ